MRERENVIKREGGREREKERERERKTDRGRDRDRDRGRVIYIYRERGRRESEIETKTRKERKPLRDTRVNETLRIPFFIKCKYLKSVMVTVYSLCLVFTGQAQVNG